MSRMCCAGFGMWQVDSIRQRCSRFSPLQGQGACSCRPPIFATPEYVHCGSGTDAQACHLRGVLTPVPQSLPAVRSTAL